MKHPFLLLLLFMCLALQANPTGSTQNSPSNRLERKANLSFEEQILDELRLIRGIQDSTYNQRQRSRQEWDLKEGKSTSELDAMYSINDNTTPNFWKNGVTFMAILALIIALITLFITVITYREQRKTAMNTQKLSEESRIILLLEDVHQLFIGAEMIYAARLLMEERKYKGYPNESFFDRIRLSSNNLEMIMGCTQDRALLSLINLKREFEKYSYEVNQAQVHLMNQAIPLKIKEADFDVIKTDVWELVRSVLNTVSLIYSNRDYAKSLLRRVIVNYQNTPFSSFADKPGEYERMDFFKGLFSPEWLNDEEIALFYKEFNCLVELNKAAGITIVGPTSDC